MCSSGTSKEIVAKGLHLVFVGRVLEMARINDRYENGAHDLSKFIKFSYGRGSDHASKDIRTGQMTRKQAIGVVRKHDHRVSEDRYY